MNQRFESAHRKLTALVRPRFDPVRPAAASANTQLPAHQARLAVDQFKNTHWAAGRTAAEAVLTLHFSELANLDRTIFTSGASNDFAASDRPKDVHLVFSNGKSHNLQLKDQAEPQQAGIKNADSIKWVEIHIISTYKSVTGKSLAISEIEFFSKQRA